MNVKVSIIGMPESEQDFELLSGSFEKFIGLLGTESTASPVLLLCCSSVHTFGMTYPIDIAFADDHGEILKTKSKVNPRQIHSCSGAYCTFERPSTELFPWFKVGQKVAIYEIEVEKGNIEQRSRYGYQHIVSKSLPSVRRTSISRHGNMLRLPTRFWRNKFACMRCGEKTK